MVGAKSKGRNAGAEGLSAAKNLSGVLSSGSTIRGVARGCLKVRAAGQCGRRGRAIKCPGACPGPGPFSCGWVVVEREEGGGREGGWRRMEQARHVLEQE